MRLRQVALASHNLDETTLALAEVFGLKVAFNDPHIIGYGLKNAVLPAGAGFLEVVEPVRAEASAARFLERRGGDAGYMIILQVEDAARERERVMELGVRVVDEIDTPAYRCAHFHPADFGGVLVSFDQQRTEANLLRPYGDWMPAGPGWREARTPEVLDLKSVTLSTNEPSALAARWANLVGRPLDPENPLRLPLDRGEIRFRVGSPRDPTLISEVGLTTRDPAEELARASSLGHELQNGSVRLGGVWFCPTPL